MHTRDKCDVMKEDMKKLSDYELILKTLNVDNFYFEEIISRYQNLVFYVINKMTVNKDEVADLSQDVFIKMYKNLDKYNPSYKFSTWVIKITSNHIIDMRRKKKLQLVELDTLFFDATKNEFSAENEFMAQEELDSLKMSIEALPEQYREPLQLYVYEGLSYQEISDNLDVPITKIKNRIFKARKLLKASATT